MTIQTVRRKKTDVSDRSATKGARTRLELIAGARRAFRRVGYLATTIGDICEEADKSTGVFYLYFKSKDDLLHALTKEFQAELPHSHIEMQNPNADPVAQLRAGVVIYWNAYKKHMDDFGGVFQAAMADAAFRTHLREIRAIGIANIAKRVRQMKARGFCAGMDPVLAGSALTGMVNFACYNWLSGGIDFERDTVDEKKAVETLSRLMVGALTSREQ